MLDVCTPDAPGIGGHRAGEATAVDVIVPVYRGLEQTRRCIQSVLSAVQRTPYELVVINDSSPEPQLAHYLASLRDTPRVTLLENGSNLGFVASVNLGMSLHPERDVVLLNSDTEVANDWLDRLRRCASSRAEIGTITPFSNNATICSYPDFCRKNELPDGLNLADLDRIFRRVNSGKFAEIPTAVGFCMYIRRACLDQVGLFDADRFGKGYGEENDFSLRAAEKGWLNVLCADIFVFHEGGASFQAERVNLQATAQAVLDALHPNYRKQVRRFIMRDPLRELRQAIVVELAMAGKSRHGRDAQVEMASTTRNTMKTIVCLNIEAKTARSAVETVRSIASGSLACTGIVVTGAGSEGSDKDALVDEAREIPMVFVSAADCLSALKRSLADSGAAGVLLVSAGMYVPYGCDVRLAKIAMQDPSVGTVSPFCDLSSVHRLREQPFAAELDIGELARLDRLAFLSGQKAYFEAREFLPQCCFVPAAVVNNLADGEAAWLGQLAEPGRLHVLSDSVYVGKLPSAALSASAESTCADSPQLGYSRKTILDAYRAGADFNSAPGLDGRPVHLHIIHDMGGGSATWLKDFSLADSSRINLVLKSFSHNNAMGCGVALYSHALEEVPLAVWEFSNEIQATVAAHLEYRGVLDEIVREYCVDAVLVSSLIGHSLDALNTGLPTVVVNHDYFPYCPAINIYFGGVCRHCDERRIGECFRDNPDFNPFVTFLPWERVQVRDRFLESIGRPNVIMATPSRSVEENLVRLDARFRQATFVTIPHGYGRALKNLESAQPSTQGRLRILVLGQISVLKGLNLLRESIEALSEFAEIYLVGCRELGELFQFRPGVHVVSQYEPDQLPGHVAAINPHVGLLTSICPETFSYALTELMMLGVPVAATRVGSFPERIRHQESGYLYEPDAASLVGTMKAIDADRETLGRIRKDLLAWQPRTADAMVSDYHRIVPLGALQCARYPMQQAFRRTQPAEPSGPGGAWPNQAVTIAGMWKEVKSLNLQLAMTHEARLRAETQFTRERKEFQRHVSDSASRVLALEESLAAKDAALAEKDGRIQALTGQVAEILSSTSWKLSGPIRWLGTGARRLKILCRIVMPVLRDPALWRVYMGKVVKNWRAGGFAEVKRGMARRARSMAVPPDAWAEYRQAFAQEVHPWILRRIRKMDSRPLISVIVPTYNTAENMLREMLASVQNQLYPDWELCVSDDGSSQPHVRKILEEAASNDRRIRLHFARENKGVSHASNRALEMATGDFVVLLDHDDILEEQALFRVAESVSDEDPDMVYSDEVLISEDGMSVKHMAFRPAFSREYLRSHPYLVHLVGFKTSLIREIGGFDETLTISQDYDLILRASEKAEKIVHIPEILYRWRIHDSSSGHAKMLRVMETSKSVLARHLERSGEIGWIDDGPGFNFFTARYPLIAGLQVAVIIPTKNHGDLVRQCIESIERTVREVAYDIVVVDHESDDPATLEYFASLPPRIRVIRYVGAFNFSAINNCAVAQLPTSYTHYLLCNNDIEAIHVGWLERMLELGQKPDVGIVGAKLYYPDRQTIQHGGVCVGGYGIAEHYAKRLVVPDGHSELGYYGRLSVNHEMSAVTAACLLVKRQAFEEVGGFDEKIAVGFGDVDLCLRVGAKGWRILYCPHAELIHHESYTRGTSTEDPHPEDSAYFLSKWNDFLRDGDPYYNPNLSVWSMAWGFRQPMVVNLYLGRRIYTRDHHKGRQSLIVTSTAENDVKRNAAGHEPRQAH